MGIRGILAGLLACGTFGIGAQAATITTHETGLEALFSIANGFSWDVDVQYLAPLSFVSEPLSVVDSVEEFVGTFALASVPVTTVEMYFVDAVNWCGGVSPNTIGCAYVDGNSMMVEGDYAAGDNGLQLVAHELAHNLGLSHNGMTSGLMAPVINSSMALTASEIATAEASSLFQDDGAGGRFLVIQPIAVAAMAAVPIPASGLLLGGAFALLPLARRRKQRRKQARNRHQAQHQARHQALHHG